MSTYNYDAGAPATGRKVMLATTCYDRPDASYTFALANSRETLHAAGIPTAYVLLSGNCHVDDARNDVVHVFIGSDCTDLVFIDADVSWNPRDLVRLCEHDADLVGGVYPYRRTDAQGLPVRLVGGDPRPVNGLIEVEGLPTGFMRIRRCVLERLTQDAQTYPSKTGPVAILFERTLDRGARWGGDLGFCNRWRATGGKVFADYEMTLGHSARIVVRDSLGAMLRRRAGTTLRDVAAKVRAGAHDVNDLDEAIRFVNNPFGAQVDVVATCVALARKADGPIIETGSGLTTILMAAAAPDQIVYCLEHSAVYAEMLKESAYAAGITNIGLCQCPIRDRWYDLSDMEIPRHYALALNDGPPRTLGDRRTFFSVFDADVIVCDDADDLLYRAQIRAFANAKGRGVEFVEPRAAIINRAA